MKRHALWSGLVTAAILCSAAPAGAQESLAQSSSAGDFARFAPGQRATVAAKLDFEIWDAALRWFVLSMGKSLREYSSRPQELTGTRITYGHDSPYRLEGNRVAFSMMPDEVKQSLTDYRRDLEELPNTVPLTQLSRNEQLAFWINLHNVAVIEQLALAYPLSSPDQLKLGSSGLPLDEAPIITVGGVKMSPKDIRTKIVYPNWSDPKVMYGFWRGEIGGPSIPREAYNSQNVSELLDESAREFINSLRGTQKRGDSLAVSKHYLEAKPFYFRNWDADLRAHLRKYSDAEVAGLLDKTTGAEASLSEPDIADLSKGERAPNYSNLLVNGENLGVEVDASVARLLDERHEKFEKIIRDGGIQGRVILVDVDDVGKEAETVR